MSTDCARKYTIVYWKNLAVKKSLLAPGPLLRFHDKGPGSDNINLLIKLFLRVGCIQLGLPIPNISLDSDECP